ncbi:hypothetical protein [Candidatus Manganitrophus noduliformans]|uniref:Uncharacterized protein n=1 Tax=Candidatus Manganitrophus noduliformans TaxID=2606439 RepID=A0A7X6I9V6_9BACT|nr:hypothetical protein [Candidatus Manganitrophus noduliformans]NKE69893.1 hypothetical protein [Candidatus Manganitrophus noduliformans]
MATLDKTGGASVSAAQPWDGKDRYGVIEKEIDLAGVATGDVLQCLKVKDGFLVHNVTTKIVTASDKVTTADVGDGADPNGFDNQIDLAAAAGTRTKGLGGTDQFVTDDGKLYSADDTIDLTVTVTSGPITVGKVLVSALYTRVG